MSRMLLEWRKPVGCWRWPVIRMTIEWIDSSTSPPSTTTARSAPTARHRIGLLEVQDLAVFGFDGDLGLEDRAIRRGDTYELKRGSIDGVVVGDAPVADLERAVAAARGYVYASAGSADLVEAQVSRLHPDAIITRRSGLLRADLGKAGYKMRPADHPLA